MLHRSAVIVLVLVALAGAGFTSSAGDEVKGMQAPVGGCQQIAKNIEYPVFAQTYHIEGSVLVRAIVDGTGKVQKASVVKGIGFGCNEAALEGVKKSEFTKIPGAGPADYTAFLIPIRFTMKH